MGLGWEESRLSRYEGALLPIITVIERDKNIWAIGFAMFLLRELIPKYKFLMKVFIFHFCFHDPRCVLFTAKHYVCLKEISGCGAIFLFLVWV